jgi:hypothetical protein
MAANDFCDIATSYRRMLDDRAQIVTIKKTPDDKFLHLSFLIRLDHNSPQTQEYRRAFDEFLDSLP